MNSVPQWQAWLMAIRPRTLPVALAPVVVGTAIAFSAGQARLFPALAAGLGALGLQVASNLANDLFDFESGADGEDRIGPARASQLGLLSSSQMWLGMAVVLGLTVLVGFYLLAVAGWPVVAVGVLSILAALAYTGGPWPFGYKGLGDPAVFFFFGVVAVTGTYYVQALAWSMPAFLASLSVGALATAILVVNNVRDIESDARANKNTLAVRFGRRFGILEYGCLMGLADGLLPVFWLGLGCSFFVLLPLLSLPRAIALWKTLAREVEGPPLNEALAGTAQLSLFFSILLAVGWLL
ncbi:MAG: 1,4-dihydroxy-2-naphthoate polyprenyltransferase [Myxococcota bacterium]|nr:1,4-dihydroxy-2-naphthoate polyprenyltransferase [Myxococcota bacterium]